MIFFHSDTLFFEDFDLQKVIKIYQDFKERDPEGNMVLYVTCSDEGEYETQTVARSQSAQLTTW